MLIDEFRLASQNTNPKKKKKKRIPVKGSSAISALSSAVPWSLQDCC